jgi:hypothetical protein
MKSKFNLISDYLDGVKPSKNFEDYERHKSAIREIIGEDSCMWIEAITELCDRMWL